MNTHATRQTFQTKIFANAFFPWIRLSDYQYQYDDTIIGRRRCAERLAEMLWNEVVHNLRYNYRASVVQKLADVVQQYPSAHPAKQAVEMVIHAFNTDKGPKGELFWADPK